MPPRRRAPRAGSRTDLPPLKIVRKILLLQVAYYVTATALILFTTVVYGTPFSLDLVFSWNALRGDTTIGWMLGLVWLLTSGIGVIFLLLLVARSKLIPDFALTLHFLHLIATTLYTHSVPANWLWWGLQGASAAFMTFLGIWACRWRELQPISFGGIGGGSSSGGGISAGASGGGEAQSGADGEESFSLSRGRGRGRGLRDSSSGGDEYEMVEMKGDAAV
ncbi:integral membrane protein of the Golgi [Aspergillus niger]|nr:integral membrane protein of the Golgi [Aspergillus niger]